MKKSFAIGLLVLVTAAVFAQAPPGGGHRGFGPRFEAGAHGLGALVTGMPYSAIQITESRQTLADGNQITRQDQSKVFRDSQGRVRIERSMTRGGAQQAPRPTILILDPVAGYSYALDSAAKTAAKNPLHQRRSSQSEPGMPRHPGPRNSGTQVQTEDLGTQIVNGVPATGTRTTETVPAGAIGNQQPLQVVRETWISTDLKVPVTIKTSDPRFGTMTMQLTNIQQAEPDAALFQVPANYAVTERARGAGRWNQ